MNIKFSLNSLKNKKDLFKIIANIFVYVGIVVILHLLAGRPILKKTENARQDWRKTITKLLETETLVRQNPNPREKMEEIMRQREEFKTRADARNELPRIIQQLTQKSSDLDIEIVSIKQIDRPPDDEAVLPDGVSKAYLEMVIKGNYRVIGEYLGEIKELPVLCTVEAVTLRSFVDLKSQKDEAKEDGKVIATLIISTYTVWKI